MQGSPKQRATLLLRSSSPVGCHSVALTCGRASSWQRSWRKPSWKTLSVPGLLTTYARSRYRNTCLQHAVCMAGRHVIGSAAPPAGHCTVRSLPTSKPHLARSGAPNEAQLAGVRLPQVDNMLQEGRRVKRHSSGQRRRLCGRFALALVVHQRVQRSPLLRGHLALHGAAWRRRQFGASARLRGSHGHGQPGCGRHCRRCHTQPT